MSEIDLITWLDEVARQCGSKTILATNEYGDPETQRVDTLMKQARFYIRQLERRAFPPPRVYPTFSSASDE